MKCKYLYRDGDKSVILGTKKIGEDCKSNGATEENGGFCPGHARQMGTMPSEKNIAGDIKRCESRRNRTKGRVGKKEKIIEKIKADAGKKREVSYEVLECLGLTSQCDLEHEYKIFVATNPKPGVESWNEKMAFARWLEAPEYLRIPKTMEEAAVILGLSIRSLLMWKTSPEILNFINDDLRSRVCGLYKLAIYNMGDGMIRGDKGLTDTYLKHLNEISEIKNSARKPLDIPKDMQKEANEYAESINQQNRGEALKSEKTLLKDTYFGNTLVNKTETEQ